MDAARPPKRNWSSLLLGFALALFVVFLVPANNRRVGMAFVRLIFGVNYGDIDVGGQPPGCAITMVPTAELSERAASERYARARIDPDWFMIELAHSPRFPVVPKTTLFENHPDQPWVALRLVSATCGFSHHADRPCYRGLFTPARIDQIITFIRHTQTRFPNNGALWLAEGLMLDLQGHDRKAALAWEEAAIRTQWDEQSAAALSIYQSARLIMPNLDAGTLAYFAMPDFLSNVDKQVQRAINDRLAQGITAGDRDSVIHWASLLARLRDCRWLNAHRPTYSRRINSWLLGDAIRASATCAPEQISCAVGSLLFANNDDALAWAWMSENLPTQAFDKLRQSEIDVRASVQRYRKQYEASDREYMLRFGIARTSGGMTILVMALCICVMLLYFTYVRSEATSNSPYDSTRYTLRWRRVFLCLPICYWIFQNALGSIRPGSLGIHASVDSPDSFSAIVCTIALMALAHFSFRIAGSRFRQRQLCLVSVIICLCTLHICTYLRSLFTNGLLFQLRHQCTGETLPLTLTSLIR